MLRQETPPPPPATQEINEIYIKRSPPHPPKKKKKKEELNDNKVVHCIIYHEHDALHKPHVMMYVQKQVMQQKTRRKSQINTKLLTGNTS